MFWQLLKKNFVVQRCGGYIPSCARLYAFVDCVTTTNRQIYNNIFENSVNLLFWCVNILYHLNN